MGLLAGIVSGISSLIGTGISNSVNQNIANQNIAYQKEANEQNIAFQREINDTNYYRQLAENELTRQREDTAVQRAMADVESAGLSKTLATGLSASSSSQSASMSSAPQVQALKNEYKYQSALQQLNLLDMYTKVQESQANVENIKASTNNINAQADFTKTQDSMYAQKTITEMNRSSAQADYFSANSALINATSESQAKKIKAEIDNIFANTDYTVSQTAKVVAEKNNLDKKTEQIVFDLTKAKYDFNINVRNGMKSTGADSAYGRLASDFMNLSNLPSGWLKSLTTGGSLVNGHWFDSHTGGGYAW